MTPVTISKELIKKGDLVLIPRTEYEDLLRLRKIREVKMSTSQKRALKRARKNRAAGRFLTLHEFERKLAGSR